MHSLFNQNTVQYYYELISDLLITYSYHRNCKCRLVCIIPSQRMLKV